MAPIVKDVESPVSATVTNLAASPAARVNAEHPATAQPVALEIPVTVNGARTVEGSDKREPFSESTKTVLVFGHGAVVRVTSPLAPGQLIFLTNEKTKKEVVCQVVKLKKDGTSAGYVELKFTEPAVGFWGMRFPADRIASGPVSPAAPRAVAPAVPSPSKLVPPAPVAAKPIAAPAIPAVVPSKPAILPPPVPVVKPEPVQVAAPVSAVVAAPVPPPVTPAPVELPPAILQPAPVSAVPETYLAPQQAPAAAIQAPTELPPSVPISASPESPVAASSVPLPASKPEPFSAPPRVDFASQIFSLFAAPPASAPQTGSQESPAHKSATESSEPTSDQLKQQTARLQEELNSLLFTEAPAVPAAPPSVQTPVTSNAAQKLMELVQAEPKPEVKRDSKPAPALIKLASTSLAADEEVKIPSWLAPLSPENSAVVTESTPSSTSVSDSLPDHIESLEQFPAAVGEEAPHRSQAAVFGGQLTGESSEASAAVTTQGSKRGLFIGVAAGVLLLAGGGIWYLQNSGSLHLQTILAPAKPAAVAPANTLPTASSTPLPKPATQPVVSSVVSAPALSTPEPMTTKPAASPVPTPKTSNVAAYNPPPVEQPTKPAFGNVHLAAPVVSRKAAASQAGDADLVITSSDSGSAAESIGGLAAGRPKAPEAPPTPVAIGGDVKPAQLLHGTPPVYPQMAKSQHLSGEVRIDALIDAQGNVTTMKVLSGPPIFHQSAMASLKQWKYKPAQLDGKPTAMHLTVTVQFHLQ